MSFTRLPAALRRRVQERAAGRCEYCLLSEDDAWFSHEPDNPRAHAWHEHFEIERGSILPRTPIGRATERLLRFNVSDRIEVRKALAKIGRYPT